MKLFGSLTSITFSPIVTIEPRRRKFHCPIRLKIPLPSGYRQDTAANLHLLCSITGGQNRALWEDVTGSTPLTIVEDCLVFTTTVSARFWLVHCRQAQHCPDSTRYATELYRYLICVPFMAKFVIFAKRRDITEANIRVFCMTDDKEERTLEVQEHYTQVAKSRDVEVIEGQTMYLEFGGNLVPTHLSGTRGLIANSSALINEQLAFAFHAFQENRLAFAVRLKEVGQEPSGRIAFMEDSIKYLASLNAQQRAYLNEKRRRAICTLGVVLPAMCVNYDNILGTPKRNSYYATSRIGDLTLADIANELDTPVQFGRPGDQDKDSLQEGATIIISDSETFSSPQTRGDADWTELAPRLGIPRDEVDFISDYCVANQIQSGRATISPALILLMHWYKLSSPETRDQELARALVAIGRDDIAKRLNFPIEPKKMSRSTMELLREIEMIPVRSTENLYAGSEMSDYALSTGVGGYSRGASLRRLDHETGQQFAVRSSSRSSIEPLQTTRPLRSSSGSGANVLNQSRIVPTSVDNVEARVSSREWTEDKNGTLSHMVEQTTFLESKPRGSTSSGSSKKQRRRKEEEEELTQSKTGGVNIGNPLDRKAVAKEKPEVEQQQKQQQLQLQSSEGETRPSPSLLELVLAPQIQTEEHAQLVETHEDCKALETSKNNSSCKGKAEGCARAQASASTRLKPGEVIVGAQSSCDLAGDCSDPNTKAPRLLEQSAESNPDLDNGIEKATAARQSNCNTPCSMPDTDSGDFSSTSTIVCAATIEEGSSSVGLNVAPMAREERNSSKGPADEIARFAQKQTQEQVEVECIGPQSGSKEELNSSGRVETRSGDLNFGQCAPISGLQTEGWGCGMSERGEKSATRFKDDTTTTTTAAAAERHLRELIESSQFNKERGRNNGSIISPVDIEEIKPLNDLETATQSLASAQQRAQKQQQQQQQQQSAIDIELSATKQQTFSELEHRQQQRYSDSDGGNIPENGASSARFCAEAERATLIAKTTEAEEPIELEDNNSHQQAIIATSQIAADFSRQSASELSNERQQQQSTSTISEPNFTNDDDDDIQLRQSGSENNQLASESSRENKRRKSSTPLAEERSQSQQKLPAIEWSGQKPRSEEEIETEEDYYFFDASEGRSRRVLHRSAPTLDNNQQSNSSTRSQNNNNDSQAGDQSSTYTTAPLDCGGAISSSHSNTDFTTLSTSQSVYVTPKSHLTAAESTSTVNNTDENNTTSDMVSFSIEDHRSSAAAANRSQRLISPPHTNATVLSGSSDNVGTPTITPNTEELEDMATDLEEEQQVDLANKPPLAGAVRKSPIPGTSQQHHQQNSNDGSNNMPSTFDDSDNAASIIDEDQLRRILTCKRLSEGCNRFNSSFITRKNSLHMFEELPPLTEGETMKHMSYHVSQNIESQASSGSSGSLRSGGGSNRPTGILRDLKRGSQDGDNTTSCSSSTSLDARSPTRRRSSTVSQCSSVLSESTRNQLNFDLSPDLPPDSSLMEANTCNSPTTMDLDNRPASPEPSSLSGDASYGDLLRPISRMSHEELMLPSPDSTLGDSNDNDELIMGDKRLERLTQSHYLARDHDDMIMDSSSLDNTNQSEINIVDIVNSHHYQQKKQQGSGSSDPLERLISDVSTVAVSAKSTSSVSPGNTTTNNNNKRPASDDLASSQIGSGFGQIKSVKSSGHQQQASLLPRLAAARTSGAAPASVPATGPTTLPPATTGSRPTSAASSHSSGSGSRNSGSSNTRHNQQRKKATNLSSSMRSRTLNTPSPTSLFETPLTHLESATNKHCSANSTCSSSSSSAASHVSSGAHSKTSTIGQSCRKRSGSSKAPTQLASAADEFRYLHMMKIEQKESQLRPQTTTNNSRQVNSTSPILFSHSITKISHHDSAAAVATTTTRAGSSQVMAAKKRPAIGHRHTSEESGPLCYCHNF